MKKICYASLICFCIGFIQIPAFALESGIYQQTLNMGSEEYFVKDNTIYPEKKEENKSVEDTQNLYNYTTVPNYMYPTYPTYPTYVYPNYTVPSYGYTIINPIIYRPNYVTTKPFPLPPQTQPKPPLPPQQQQGLRQTTQRPFTFNYGYSTPYQSYSPQFKTNSK